MASRHREESKMRIMLAQESARLMADEGVRDFLAAKRKAAARLGVSNKALFPSNLEIERAMLEYQRLFQSTRQPHGLRALRQAAIEAMRFFDRFQPRLVGPVLTDTAGPYEAVNLHLFADTAEDVVLFLLEHNIPFEATEKRMRFGNGEYAFIPGFSFGAGEVNVELSVFTNAASREAPRSPVDGKPMRRANLAQVKALLAK